MFDSKFWILDQSSSVYIQSRYAGRVSPCKGYHLGILGWKIVSDKPCGSFLGRSQLRLLATRRMNRSLLAWEYPSFRPIKYPAMLLNQEIRYDNLSHLLACYIVWPYPHSPIEGPKHLSPLAH